MEYYKLPITSEPNQTFNTTIPVDGKNINFRLFLNWNVCTKTWEISGWQGSTEEPLFLHIPLIENDNIIKHLKYKGVGGITVVNNGGLTDRPELENLGTEWLLYWITP